MIDKGSNSKMIIRTTTASVYYPIAKRGTNRFAGAVESDRWAPMSSCAAKPEPAMKVPLQAGRSACALRKKDGLS